MPSSLFARQNPLDDARNTISSWDNCMAKSYCKWPVIVAIIVASLILISVVTCIARCICCGAECACCCFRCCSCCCGSGGRSSHKRIKSEAAPPYHSASYPAHYGQGGGGGGSAPIPPNNPYAQAHAVAPRPSIDTRPVNQQYRSNAMPTYGPPGGHAPERPQFATFDSTRAVVNEDSLPAMPTWKGGRDVHVQVEEAVPEKKGDVELNRLDRNGSMASARRSAAGGAAGTGAARKSPGPARSPVSPMADSYGFPPPGYQNSQDGYTSANASANANAVPPRRSPAPQHAMYAPQHQYSTAGDTYGHVSPGSGRNNGYGQQHQQANQQAYGRHHAASQQQGSIRSILFPESTKSL
ncbi:predicted protein [Plenodomus lingam JN3]|uniref:Predicted protein n=1 Tax=Leptosphaeria maculans (strain JN3 / isolate v23.1.3 / race Av1-4-5-6-7-8) TaxID=985895 RepID=E4ZPN1_LEPMJ|nr:predicted protein [Plenodomus lingam JN3]CBX93416.1 predicted protein [Plenodomus lingam JN3]